MECPRKSMHVAVLGCGFMGTAILSGLLSKIPATGKPDISYSACVRSSDSLARLKKALGSEVERVKCVCNNFVQTAKKADIVILGVPPGELNALLEVAGLVDALSGKIVISLLAGISCAKIVDVLATSSSGYKKEDFHVLRVIPSIGASINDSVSLIAKTPYAGEEQQQLCIWLFEQLGGTHLLPENLMNEATAAGAACHALTIVAVDSIVDACVAEGLPRAASLALAAQSMRSAAGLLVSKMTPETLKEAISVPQGITINSLVELERSHMRAAICDATRLAMHRARNM